MLEVKALRKRYGQVEAVRGVSFTIRPGQCFGLLGPNGAGKSTTLEMLEQVLEPDSGEIWYDGKPVGRDFKRKLGVQFQATALPTHLKVIEVLRFFAKLYGSTKPLEPLIERCQLGAFLNQKHDAVSGGQKQRLMLAIALCHDPEIVLLDEPTTGLDPQARRNVWSIVRSIQASGKTVLLTTHYMDEAEELCDEIAIMDHGQIISQGNPKALLAELQAPGLEDLFLRLTGEGLRQ